LTAETDKCVGSPPATHEDRPTAPGRPGEKLPRPLRRFLSAVGATLFGVVVSLVLLEVGLRLVTPQWLALRMRELNAGQPLDTGSDEAWPEIRTNACFRQFEPGATFYARHAEYQHLVTIDELGGRVLPLPTEPGPLLPVLGDSFTFGLGVKDGETFLALSAPSSPMRWLNLGVPGSGLHDQLNIVELRHRELGAPETYVFVLFMGNDLTDVRKRHERAAALGAGFEPDDGRGWLWETNTFVVHHPVLKRVYLIQFLRQKVLWMSIGGRPGYMEPVFAAMRTDASYLEDSLNYLRLELERLERLSHSLGFHYLFVLLPDVYQLDELRRSWKAKSIGLREEVLDPDRLTVTIRATLDDFGIPYADLTPCLSEVPVHGLFYLHDNHFTAAGHAVAASCLRQHAVLAPLFEP